MVSKDKLYEDIPDTILPSVAFTIYVLLILALEATGTYSTNPAIFFGVPILYLVLFIKNKSIDNVIRVFGFELLNDFQKGIALIGTVVGAGIGSFLAWWGVNKATSLIALYPFAFASALDIPTRTASFLSISPTIQSIIFIFVAFGEEIFVIMFFKNFANWFYPAVKNRINLEVSSILLARILWASMHWFAYRGIQQPMLYVSAIAIGIIFTSTGWLFGAIAQRTQLSQIIDERRSFNIPFMMYPVVAAHLMFDVVMVVLLGA